MAARLKVFVTSDGLADYVVAASSRPKALAAWGARQDLFGSGAAWETDEPELVSAALAKPGEVLKRAAASQDLPAKLPTAAKPKGPSKAALMRVEALESRIASLDTQHRDALTALAAERAVLDAREAAAAEHHAAERQRLHRDLAKARRDL